MSGRPTRHSYSSISTYEECPAKYAYSYIQGLPWPSSAAMERGTMLHQMAEDYMNKKVDSVPFELRKISRELKLYREHDGRAEAIWLVDENWRPVTDQSLAKLKAIVDVHRIDGDVLHLSDYKSGREYPSHRSQLELYSVMGLAIHNQCNRAESSAVYIDGGFSGSDGSIIRDMLPKLQDTWSTKVFRIENDSDFIANPGGGCRWCPYRKSAGGPCGDSAKAGV